MKKLILAAIASLFLVSPTYAHHDGSDTHTYLFTNYDSFEGSYGIRLNFHLFDISTYILIGDITCSFDQTLEEWVMDRFEIDETTAFAVDVPLALIKTPKDACVFLQWHIGGVILGKWDLNSKRWE